MNELIKHIEEEELGRLIYNTPAKKLTSLGIGGTIKYLYYPKDMDSLIKVVKVLVDKKMKYFVLGNGTNLLFKDTLYDYLFIKLSDISNMVELGENVYSCEAGAQGINFSKFVINHKSSGSEFMSIIPGTVGGLIYMNASSYNQCISDYLEKVEYLDEYGQVCELDVSKNKNKFEYRKSFFTNTNYVILKGYFRFLKGNDSSKKKVENYVKRKRLSQPLEYKSAGSTFRNFNEIPAWKLIDNSGFRNFRIGNVCISKKHANFLVNLSNSSFVEVYSLIETIKDKVFRDSGYKLECELEIVEP